MSREPDATDEQHMAEAVEERPDGHAEGGSAIADGADAESERSDGEPRDRATLAAQVDLLQEENRRLREEYTRARQSNYRRTAVGLVFVGLIAVIGGVLFPGARTVLFALGATGLFGALLTYYLTPERFISVSVGEAIYGTLADNGSALADDLGLTDPVYVPRDTTDDVRLFLPQADRGTDETALPDDATLEPGFVIEDTTRGLALVPTGDELFDEFGRSLNGPLADSPGMLAEQLGDGLVEQFELVDGTEVDAGREQVTIGISGSAYGDIGRFDHPVASFLAAGYARAFEVPAEATVSEADGRADIAVTVRPAAADETFGAAAGQESTDTERAN